jgi:hypothetical protein
MPVTISGFIIGIFVTDNKDLLEKFLLNFDIPTAAAVPITVEIVAELIAKIKVFFSALKVSGLLNSSLYQ